jgi:pyruvate dehydrogenase (quinone)
VSKIASELLIQRLIDWDVDTVFGLPGDGINGIVEGLRRHQEDIRFVLVHHGGVHGVGLREEHR